MALRLSTSSQFLASFRMTRSVAGISLAALIAVCGCKSSAGTVDDTALTAGIQKQLSADSAIPGQSIQTVVTSGVATLSGTVANDAQRAIAARDAASFPGVKEVVNNITLSNFPLASAQVAAPPTAVVPYSTPTAPTQRITPSSRVEPRHQPAPIERPQQAYNQPSVNPQPVYTPPAPQPAPQQASATAQPTFRTVTVSSGSTVPVRITQTLDSASTQPDSTFTGVVASDIVIDGLVAIPAGSSVSGQVDAVHEAGHFKGSSLLTISLSSISRRGDRIPVTTEPYSVSGKGRGVNTAEKAGGGAAVGAILGGIFGGGKGAAIGAAAGGGVGAGANGVTRGQQVQIESESVVRFRLAAPITVRARTDATPGDTRSDPNLERHHTNN